MLSFWQEHKKLNQFEALDFYLMVGNSIMLFIAGYMLNLYEISKLCGFNIN